MSAQKLQQVRALVPQQHQAAFDQHLANCGPQAQDKVLETVEKVANDAKGLGVNIDWNTIMQLIQMLIQLFGGGNKPPAPASQPSGQQPAGQGKPTP